MYYVLCICDPMLNYIYVTFSHVQSEQDVQRNALVT